MPISKEILELVEGDPTPNALAVLNLLNDEHWRITCFREVDALNSIEPIWAAVYQAVEHLGCTVDWSGTKNSCYIGYAVANILGWD